jgi:antitoxin PrlF
MSAKVTSKGQITVPKAVREALGVYAGDSLSFVVHDDGTVTVEAETVDLQGMRGALKAGGKKVTVEQMNDVIRTAAARK